YSRQAACTAARIAACPAATTNGSTSSIVPLAGSSTVTDTVICTSGLLGWVSSNSAPSRPLGLPSLPLCPRFLVEPATLAPLRRETAVLYTSLAPLRMGRLGG